MSRIAAEKEALDSLEESRLYLEARINAAPCEGIKAMWGRFLVGVEKSLAAIRRDQQARKKPRRTIK